MNLQATFASCCASPFSSPYFTPDSKHLRFSKTFRSFGLGVAAAEVKPSEATAKAIRVEGRILTARLADSGERAFLTWLAVVRLARVEGQVFFLYLLQR